MNSNSRHKRMLAATIAAMFLVNGGCGLLAFRNPDFDNAETGEDGQVFVLDDLEAIAADPDLSDDEKRDAFAELGIEDPDLIDALLN